MSGFAFTACTFQNFERNAWIRKKTKKKQLGLSVLYMQFLPFLSNGTSQVDCTGVLLLLSVLYCISNNCP